MSIDLEQLRKERRSQIAKIFDVPSLHLGAIPITVYEERRSVVKQFWREALCPIVLRAIRKQRIIDAQ